jgi:hypothetical protein
LRPQCHKERKKKKEGRKERKWRQHRKISMEKKNVGGKKGQVSSGVAGRGVVL